MVSVVGVLAFGLLILVTRFSTPNAPGDQAPRVSIVTSQPTLSQDFAAGEGGATGSENWPTAIPQVAPTATVPLPTLAASPTLPPGEFAVGVEVRVIGVEASGLNIRAAPGYSGTPRFLAGEGEIFVVVDGPQRSDDLEWWRVEDPDDPNRSGWAARNFLTAE